MYEAGSEAGPPSWYRLAACQGIPVDQFYPERAMRGTAKAAKAVCGSCPARSECLLMALELDDMYGTWGGTSANERDGFVKGRLPLPDWTDGRHDKAIEAIREKRKNYKQRLVRERVEDVQSMLARGLTIDQIAEIMGVTTKSVYKYRGMAA